MPKLPRFSTPGRLPDKNPGAWSDSVRAILADYVARFPQFYDPTTTDTPTGTPQPMISWAAFPARLRRANRLSVAERDRNEQDEYCEWTVQKAGGKITRVTFTTEVPEYYKHLFRTDPNGLVNLYRQLVDPRVKLSHLRGSDGDYASKNRWNHPSRSGRLAHLLQGNNNLFAAVDLIARATIPRVDVRNKPVTDQQALVDCARALATNCVTAIRR